MKQLFFKIASEPWEFEQIHKLNYKTFVEEIPQHEKNPEGMLVDKFHNENTYAICLHGDKVVGMVSVRGKRPFSLDKKMENLDSYLPKNSSICEIRLLAVEKEFRNGAVFKGLLDILKSYCLGAGYNVGIISGYLDRLPLYKSMGFETFGPVVGENDTRFQPMLVTYQRFKEHERQIDIQLPVRLNLLPGPIRLSDEVMDSLKSTPISHRSEQFLQKVSESKKLICELTNARSVEFFMGSGTLANDAIAAQLSLIKGRGLILSNGEFGNRLIDQAARFNLSFDTYKSEYGESYDHGKLEEFIKTKDFKWLWAVHCETSTGILNDMDMLKKICKKNNFKLCMDCISTIGLIPLDLNDIYLTSGVSGKGVGSVPGISFVLYNHEIKPHTKLPIYCDIGYYNKNNGVPFTMLSSLVLTLNTALNRVKFKERYDELAKLSSWLRSELKAIGFEIIGSENICSPAVITLKLPKDKSSKHFGELLDKMGYFLSYRSSYLIERNLVQFCLMGEHKKEDFTALLNILKNIYKNLP